jgi:hypothetical protein
MLAPGESLSTALKRLGGGRTGAVVPEPRTPARIDQTDPGLTPVRDVPSMEPVFIQPGRRPTPAPGQRPTPADESVPGAGGPEHGAPGPGQRRAPQHSRPGAGDAALTSVRKASGRAIGELRRAPRTVRIGLIAVVSVLALAIGAVGVVVLSTGSGKPARTGSSPGPSVASPLIAIQEYRDSGRNFAVNLPSGWTKNSTTSYVDFVDPQDKGRWLRINVEKAGGTARQFLDVAERQLKDPARRSSCAAPYNRLGLHDTDLAGHPAGELEYTCGQGVQMRHAIWRATVVDGKAYGFFVTVPASRFDESVAIYREMVRSFRIEA